MQQKEIWSVILFLSRKQFQAKQIFVLSSSMKLGPCLLSIGFLASTVIRFAFLIVFGFTTRTNGIKNENIEKT